MQHMALMVRLHHLGLGRIFNDIQITLPSKSPSMSPLLSDT